MIYGYARISTIHQSIERQNRNILEKYPSARLINESYTGTSSERKAWRSLMKRVKRGDVIVFDSVCRMSRNADDGIKDYMELLDRGIQLEFLKEPTINSEIYLNQLENSKIEMTDNEIINEVLSGINKALKLLAEQQVKIAFEQAEKEVQDLKQRTKEGILTAKAKGKIIGRPEGSKITTKKSIKIKEKILKLSKSFDGSLTDKEILELLPVSRNSYYKYKSELKYKKTLEN